MRRVHKRLIWTGGVLMLLLVLGGIFYRHRTSQNSEAGLTIRDFSFVHRGITLDEIKTEIGEPEPNSSVYVYEYTLCNGDRVKFRFSEYPGLQGAWIVHADGVRRDFFTREVLPKLDLDDFDFLERGVTTYDEVIRRAGEPDAEELAHTAIYRLADGRSLLLLLGSHLTQDDVIYVVSDAWVGSDESGKYDHVFGE